jgi:TonB family protein
VSLNEVPQLLVQWSSPWEEFVSSVGPALRRSPPALDAEAKAGLFPWRGILAASLVEIVAVVATAVAHPVGNSPLAAIEEQPRSHDIIFFSADELPRTRDLGGAPKGEEGKSGGSSAHHAIQTIKVARGETVREKVLDAPQLNLPKSDADIKNLLSFKADAGPAPVEALASMRRPVTLPTAVAPPPPELRDQLRRQELLQQQVAPPPVELSAQLSSRRNLAASASVVPPPVSAPPQAPSYRAQLTLPAEAVVGPRPDLNAARSRRDTLGQSATVAPPPVEMNAARGRSIAGLGASQNVAPPPVELNTAHSRSLTRLDGTENVAQPPVNLQSMKQRTAASLGNADVAPPPVEMNSRLQARTQLPGTGAVAPPQETPRASQSNSAGVIVSPKPGEKAGQPTNPERTMLAMSPAGNAAGAGSSGGGSGITHGNASGSSSAGSSSGASFSGAGKSADASPHTGSSTNAGPGGAGDRYNGRIPGVSVSGGTNTVTLPSFGGPEPKAGGHSDVHKNSNGITVVASPRAGGAMNYYGLLKGDRVYTIYFRTAAGMVSLQFADPGSAAHPYTEDLIAPQALRNEVPIGIGGAHLVLKCVMDRSGALKNVSVLQSSGDGFEKQILAALPDWKFSPAYRGSEPVEVNVILGFGVDTK